MCGRAGSGLALRLLSLRMQRPLQGLRPPPDPVLLLLFCTASLAHLKTSPLASTQPAACRALWGAKRVARVAGLSLLAAVGTQRCPSGLFRTRCRCCQPHTCRQGRVPGPGPVPPRERAGLLLLPRFWLSDAKQRFPGGRA